METPEFAKEQIGAMLSAATNAAGVTGFGDGVVRQATKAAAESIKNASITVGNAIPSAERIAADKRTYPEGRADMISEVTSNMVSAVENSLGAAEAALIVAQANATIDARPQLSGDVVAAQNHLDRVLARTPKDNLTDTILSLASRDTDIAAMLHTEYGKDLLSSYGYDDSMSKAIDVAAMQAAEHSSSPKRRAAFQTNKQLGQMRGAAAGARAAAHAAQDFLTGLGTQAGTDPRDAEIARLRSMLSTQRGHAR